MTWPLHDPAGLLAGLKGASDAQRVDLREVIGEILEDPFDAGHGVTVHPLRGVEKGDAVDVFVAYLPHDWLMTYEVHLRQRDGGGSPRVVLLALLTMDDILGQ